MEKLSSMVSYLKGLAEGMNLSDDTPERKLLLKILETLEAFGREVEQLAADLKETDEYLENVDEDLSALEEAFYEDEEDEEAEEDGEDFVTATDGDGYVEYECPSCGYQTRIDITDFDFEEDYLCPRCSKPFFPDLADGEEEEGEGGA